MQDDYNQQFVKKREFLMNSVTTVLRKEIKNTNKSLKLFSREYDFGDGQISKLLRNLYSDVKLSTIWKLANALEISPVRLIDLINKNLPDNFNFYD